MTKQERELDEVLAHAPPFSILPSAERRAVAAELHPKNFSDQEVLFSEGEAASGGWLVCSGAVRVLAYYGNSRLMQIERAEKGQLVGLFCRLARASRVHQCTAVADGPVVAAHVPDAVFDARMASSPAFACRSLTVCSAKLLCLRRLLVQDREPVEQRLARVLVELCRTQGSRLKETRRDLAVQTGTAVETVFRVLARFRSRRWLKKEDGSIVICDLPALAAAAGGASVGRRKRV